MTRSTRAVRGYGERMMRRAEDVARDVRHAARRLLRSPGFSLAVVLTLAVGIGGNTAVFSVVDQLLQRALTEKLERQRRALIEDVRSVLSQVQAADPGFIRVEERDHMWFRAIVSVVGRPVGAEITLGNVGGRVAPGPRFENYSRLLDYLRTEFVTYVAELVAESKLEPDKDQVYADGERVEVAVDREEQNDRSGVAASADEGDELFESASDEDANEVGADDGEDVYSCEGSFSIVLKRDVSPDYIICPYCGASFTAEDLHEVDDQDGELCPPRHPAILGSLARHIPREAQLEASR